MSDLVTPESTGYPPDISQDPEQELPEQKDNKIRNIISTAALFLAAPIFAMILIIFVIQSYEVDGPSMQNTLHNADLLIVNKTPKTWSKITRKPYIPKRYDIIIFVRNEGGYKRQLVKRVIGLPGESVTVENGQVTVFNSEHPQGFNPDQGQEYSNNFDATSGRIIDTVDENEVFVMGDNRSNSLDSRSFGSISAETIVGKLGIRIFPLSDAKTF